MNKTNLWEMSAYMMMLRPRSAFRRFGVQSAPITGIPNRRFEVRYYTRQELEEVFGGSFRFESVQSYPLMPPPTFNSIFGKLPRYLNWAGKKGNGRLNGWGDHMFVIMERI
jgi:hypothetical protein